MSLNQDKPITGSEIRPTPSESVKEVYPPGTSIKEGVKLPAQNQQNPENAKNAEPTKYDKLPEADTNKQDASRNVNQPDNAQDISARDKINTIIKILSYIVIGIYIIIVLGLGVTLIGDFTNWSGSEFNVLLSENIFAEGKPHFFFLIGEFIGGILIILQMIAAVKAV